MSKTAKIFFTFLFFALAAYGQQKEKLAKPYVPRGLVDGKTNGKGDNIMRKALTKIALAASLGLALAFTLGCTSDNDSGSSSSNEAITGSSSSVASSSSLADASSSSYLDTYLGLGYDVIKSSYINSIDVKISHPILDREKMIRDGLVAFRSVSLQEFKSFVGNSLTKFYEERNENIGLGLNASVPFKSILFSGNFETEFGVKLNESKIDKHSYLRGRSYHYTHHEYISNGRATAEKLSEYLSEGFAAALHSKTAAEILDRYGSHVFIQYYKGGVMEYNYAYFGTELSKSSELLNALKISLSANSKLLGASIGVSSSLNDDEKHLREELENNSTFRSYTYGGTLVNASSVEQIENNYSTWINSIENKADICGIGKFDESFIPMWELVAASGLSKLAKELEKEFLDRAAKQAESIITMKSVMIRKEFTTNDTYIFDKFPATIEIYALGAGGGGQGGYGFNRPLLGYVYGTGGAGGGGATTYAKFEIQQPDTFKITVGRGGSGGSYVKNTAKLISGNKGENGGNTKISWGSGTNIITALGGVGGGGDDDVVNGGSGGRGNTEWSVVNLLDKYAVSGTRGTDGATSGSSNQDNESRGGSAGKIEIGSVKSFGGGQGAYRPSGQRPSWQSGSGGGGAGEYADRTGSTGGNGQVIIVVTYFEKEDEK